MTARLVTRHWAADEEMAKGTKPLVLVPVVTDADAQRLEEVVEAARQVIGQFRGVILAADEQRAIRKYAAAFAALKEAK